MNLLDFGRTPLWARLGGGPRGGRAEDGVELAESELIGLAPLAAFQAVADRAGAPRDAPPEERVLAAGALPEAAGRLAAAWRSSCGSRPRAARRAD